MKRGYWLLVIATFLLVLSGIVFADYLVAPSSFSYNQSIVSKYNITINNTESDASANITQVNITLPSNFSYAASSNWTDANGTFSNASSILTWVNSDGLVMNLSWNYFAFNATCTVPGNYNITVTAINATGWSFDSNISVTINDTTAPTITYNSVPANGANLSQNYLIFNITAADNVAVDTLTLRVYNSTPNLINTTLVNSTNLPLYLNLSNLSEGVYSYNLSVNDSSSNVNNSATKSVRLDTTKPTISIDSDPVDRTTAFLNISITTSDSGSGISDSGCTVDIKRGSTSVSGEHMVGNGTKWYAYDESLQCDETYTFNITCQDRAGNTKSSSEDFDTEICPDSAGGGGAASFWTNTYYPTDAQAREGFSRSLKKGERMRIGVGTESHYVGVVLLGSTSVTINVSSTTQQAIFSAGEIKSFEVTGDNYYDIKVKLNSVNSSGANITAWQVHDLMPVITSPTGAAANVTAEGNESVTTATAESASAFFSNITKNNWFWAGLSLVVVAGIAVWTFIYLRKRKRVAGY